MVDEQHVGGNKEPLLNVGYHGAPSASRGNSTATRSGCNGCTVQQTIDVSGFLPLVMRQLKVVNINVVINKRKHKHTSELKPT